MDDQNMTPITPTPQDDSQKPEEAPVQSPDTAEEVPASEEKPAEGDQPAGGTDEAAA
ncbi:hypothetical protein JXA59_00540 [Patescibacteria group bacterium]|nr:hypothetical protein [Patescibacteria group bacterium]